MWWAGRWILRLFERRLCLKLMSSMGEEGLRGELGRKALEPLLSGNLLEFGRVPTRSLGLLSMTDIF